MDIIDKRVPGIGLENLCNMVEGHPFAFANKKLCTKCNEEQGIFISGEITGMSVSATCISCGFHSKKDGVVKVVVLKAHLVIED